MKGTKTILFLGLMALITSCAQKIVANESATPATAGISNSGNTASTSNQQPKIKFQQQPGNKESLELTK